MRDGQPDRGVTDAIGGRPEPADGWARALGWGIPVVLLLWIFALVRAARNGVGGLPGSEAAMRVADLIAPGASRPHGGAAAPAVVHSTDRNASNLWIF